MSDLWKRWEGQLADNRFPLLHFLAATNHSAVFLTQNAGPESRQAAIKFISADHPASEQQLAVWGQIAQLSHPNLLRIFHAGRCRIEDMSLLYVVMECAEENLAQFLPQRPLTPEEARDMLNPVVDVLVYLHAKSLAHTHIKPSNLLAIADQLKLSSDTIFPVGPREAQREPDLYDAPEVTASPAEASRPAADVWSLGVTLVEALTQTIPALPFDNSADPLLPDSLPQPFLDIARHALLREPKRRWSAPQIAARLSGIPQPAITAVTPAALASAASAGAGSVKSSSAAAISPLSVPLSPEPAIPLSKLPATPPSKRPASKPLPSAAEKSAPEEAFVLPNYVVPLLLGAFLLVIAVLALPRLFRYRADSATSANSTFPQPAAVSTAPAPPAVQKSPQQNAAKSPAAKKPVDSLASENASLASAPRPQGAGPSLAVMRSQSQPPATSATPAASNPARGEVLDQVLPSASEKALATIHGAFHVMVRVQVDPSGNVTNATLEDPGPSKYFANLAEQAARRWQFSSPDSDGHSLPSEWLIRFEFTSAGARAVPTQTVP
jgi:TonB family protein